MFSSLNHIHTACRLGVGSFEVCLREMGACLGLNGAANLEIRPSLKKVTLIRPHNMMCTLNFKSVSFG